MRIFITTQSCKVKALIMLTDKKCSGLKELKSFAREWYLTAPVFTGDGEWICLPTQRTKAEFNDNTVKELAARLFGGEEREFRFNQHLPGGGVIFEIL